MSRIVLKLLAVSLVLALSISVGSAAVELKILKTLNLDAPPLDMAVFPNGKYVFILTHDSKVRIYDLNGRLRDQFNVARQASSIAIADNGGSVFVLADKGRIYKYGLNGDLRDTIETGKEIDQIKLDPRGIHLFASNRQKQTLDVIAVEFIQKISIEGSPFKGLENAPVVIAEFSDFE